MGTCRFLRVLIDSYGLLSIVMGSYQYLWLLIATYGYLLILMSTFSTNGYYCLLSTLIGSYRYLSKLKILTQRRNAVLLPVMLKEWML